MNNRSGIELDILIIIALCIITACLLTVHKQIGKLDERVQAVEQKTEELETVRQTNFTEASTDMACPVIAESLCVNEAENTETNIECALNEDATTEYVTAVMEDIDYVLRVLTAEGGTDELMCGCVAQCLYNACEKHDWRYTPAEMMKKYQYTAPANWISDAAEKAYDDVFCCGVTYECIENATVFYAPKYCSGTPWHESQRFVCEINGVRFFEEVG